MSYVLGTAAATNAPLRLQNTVSPDGFESLAKAYGVTVQAIWDMQPELRGKPITVQNTEPFVRSRAGWTKAAGLFPFKAGGKPNNPSAFGAGVPGEGFAHFTDDTQLMLPDMPRLDGKNPRTPGLPKPPSSGPSKAGMNVLAGVAALAIIGFAAMPGKKKGKASGRRRTRRTRGY